MPLTITPEIIAKLRAVTLEAGEKILEIYATDFAVYEKDDESPVTVADQAAEKIITPVLQSIWPDVPVVGEEAASDGDIPDISNGAFWLVDPVDGTKQFIQRKDEFTVNIGLIEDQQPILGIVYVPVLGDLYIGGPDGATLENIKQGGGAKPIACRPVPEKGIVAVASRSHRTPETDEYLNQLDLADCVSSGSSIKFCMVAKGVADVYPRFGPTMEWDTAAAHAVLRAAGGDVTQVDGSPFLYAKPGFRNPNFIAKGA